jgi:hypothetical protein
VLLGLAGLLGLALLWHGPVAQWASYHAFADQRALFGIPNAADVLSNLPFALLGLWGLRSSRSLPHSDSRLAWRLFCVALLGTAAGSAFYHWAPANASLVFDRLPIAWACAALSCAFLAERVDARWARPAALAAALGVASVSVALWWTSEIASHSDLRAHLFVQFLPMALVPAGLLLKLPRRFAAAVPDGGWWALLGGYVVAKAFELTDHAVLAQLGLLSGHTLKHLAAAVAALCVLRAMLRAATLSCGSPR